jgi:hypothetical protein
MVLLARQFEHSKELASPTVTSAFLRAIPKTGSPRIKATLFQTEIWMEKMIVPKPREPARVLARLWAGLWAF